MGSVPVRVHRDIMTEARRLAGQVVKAEMRRRCYKPDSAKEVSYLANKLVMKDFYYIYEAQRLLNDVSNKVE